LTRRLFLAGTAGSLTAATPAFWKTAIGLNGFGSSERVFHKHYELEGILKFARDEGFNGVELWPFHEPYPEPGDEGRIRALRRKVESYGVSIFSIQTRVRGANPLDAAAAVRRRYTELMKGQIDLARKLGCVAAGVWPPPVAAAKGLGEDEAVERLADALRPVVDYAGSEGLIFAIEGEPPLVINGPARYKKLFAAVGRKEFKVIFDPSHFDLLTGGKLHPELLLEELGVSRVGYVQLTDGDGTLMRRPDGSVGTSKHLAVGEGKYDVQKLLDILYQGGFRGWIQIDTWETEDPFHASLAGKKAVDLARRRLSRRG
jgi:sugar phosphate isomerase/epimerase